MFQLCINQFVSWFVQIRVNTNLLFTRLNSHPKTLTHLSTLKVLPIREHILILFIFDVFIFRFAFESYEEFGGAPCKFCRNMLKDNNTLFYHIMMDLCLEYIGKELSKSTPPS